MLRADAWGVESTAKPPLVAGGWVPCSWCVVDLICVEAHCCSAAAASHTFFANKRNPGC